MSYSVILMDDPAPMVRRITLNRPEKRNPLGATMRAEILHALRAARPRRRRARHRSSAARASASPRATTSAAARVGEEPDCSGRARARIPARSPGLDEHLGPRQAGDRAGAQLLPRRRDRARHRVRPRLRRRGRADRLPRGALRHARHAVPRVDDGDAHRHGADAHRRRHERHRSRRVRVRQPRVSRSTSSRSACSRSRSASRPIPTDIVQINKRTVRRAMENMGMRESIRAGIPLCARPRAPRHSRLHARADRGSHGSALQKRDAPFGDYRTAEERDAK